MALGETEVLTRTLDREEKSPDYTVIDGSEGS